MNIDDKELACLLLVASVQHAEIYLERFYFIPAFQSDIQPRNMYFFYQVFFFFIYRVEFSGNFSSYKPFSRVFNGKKLKVKDQLGKNPK